MKIMKNLINIADLNRWIDEKELVVNKDYQRSKGLWPVNARTYFIDSILNGFPFPIITLRQTIDLKTRKSFREIIDGQQRLTTINDFINDKLLLAKASDKYAGFRFSELDTDKQKEFLAYDVSVNTVLSALEEEVLQIFRRINSYSLPLNEAEKRHGTFQGEFKWFILKMIQKFSPMFESFDILSTKQIARMEDAELLAELIQILDVGIMTRSNPKLYKLYKKYDIAFSSKSNIERELSEVLNYIKIELSEVCSANVLKKYSFYSLYSALVYNKWGIKGIDSHQLGNLSTINKFSIEPSVATQNILELFNAVDIDDDIGKYKEFVKANKRATGNKESRLIRLKWLVGALQNNLHSLF